MLTRHVNTVKGIGFFAMIQTKGLVRIASVVFCVAPLMTAPARSSTTVCTPGFGSSVSPGAIITAAFTGPIPPCPASPVSANIDTGAAAANAGVVFATDYILGPGTNNFMRTSPTSVAVAASASSSELISLTFTQPLQNPYLFFSFIDPNTSFTFNQPYTLAQAFNASSTGSTVTSSGMNTQNDGFVVQLLGTHSSLGFNYNNSASFANSVALTVGTPVPGPLPLIGAGMAFGFSRKLRARLRA
jgi:hypothetical protein